MIRLARREPASVAADESGLSVLDTSPIGFGGAAEDDRRRWLDAFRHMLDGLDAPLQVVIDVVPGSDDETITSMAVPLDPDDMRGADMEFAAAVRRSETAHSISTKVVIAEKHSARVQTALTETGIGCTPCANPAVGAFGRELASRFQHVGGFSRSWY